MTTIGRANHDAGAGLDAAGDSRALDRFLLPTPDIMSPLARAGKRMRSNRYAVCTSSAD
jgi:hypothetical protein